MTLREEALSWLRDSLSDVSVDIQESSGADLSPYLKTVAVLHYLRGLCMQEASSEGWGRTAEIFGSLMADHERSKVLAKLQEQLRAAGDRRDAEECDRLEEEIERLERDGE